jgi:hypothetical protein
MFPASRDPVRPRPLLKPNRSLDVRARRKIARALSALPNLQGDPIALDFLPQLTVQRGKLLSRAKGRGTPVYAACFIRKRRMVLEVDLLADAEQLRLIVVHELFHFVWARLGNTARREYSILLEGEFTGRARGELGESAGRAKTLLPSAWRDYVCESFCDSAAWLYAGVRQHPEFTLARRWRNLRAAWFELTFARIRGF